MLRVSDMEQSIRFYTKILGMKVLRTIEQPDEKYKLAFLGYGDELESAALELTYNYDIKKYDHGSAYGHIAISVKDIYRTCNEMKASGVNITRDPGPLKGSNEIIAFISDPDGFKIELIQD